MNFFLNKGWGLLQCYDNSLRITLEKLFPEHGDLFRYHGMTRDYWKDDVNQHRKYLDWFFAITSMDKMEDWYEVDPMDIFKMGGRYLLSLYQNSMYKVIRIFFLSAIGIFSLRY
jgi:hypothetical protein